MRSRAHPPGFTAAVTKAYGSATTDEVASRFGITAQAVHGIWQRAVKDGKLKRTRWQASSPEHIAKVLSLQGRMSASAAGRTLGISKNAVLGVWRYHGTKQDIKPAEPVVSNVARELAIEAVQVKKLNIRPTSSHDSEYVTISVPRVRFLEDAA